MRTLLLACYRKVYRLADRFALIAFFALLSVQAQAADAVTIDQQPLSVRQAVSPNVMLMLDDSGSMDYDYMPDWSYIGHCYDYSGYGGCSPYTNELQDASINGTYYSPNVIYSPPPKADGTSYPNSPSISNAYYDGFTNTSASSAKDVTQYSGSYDYYTKVTSKVAAGSYPPEAGCNSGDDLMTSGSHDGQCRHDSGNSTYWKDNAQHGWYYGKYGLDYGWYCPDDNGNNGQLKWKGGRYQCRYTQHTYSYYSPSLSNPYCDQGDYDSTTGQCLVLANKTTYLFTYTSHDVSGNVTYHFVGKNQQDCNIALADTDDYPGATCDYSAATQQNVANWFSYYRTRMLMAKSGLMNSFADLGEDYRIGFASLHNNGGFPSDVSTVKVNGYRLGQVKAFGDGSSGTQKSAFWEWVVDAEPDDGTPLRSALQAVGDYYKTAQPWQSTDSAGNTQNLSCRQSYAILTTDGFWNGGSPDVDDVDGVDGAEVKGPNGESYTYSPEAPFKDAGKNGDDDTLADVAMYYWNHDLMSSLANEVPISPYDPAFWQHMVTFTIGMGFTPKDRKGNDIGSTTVQSLLDWTRTPGDDNKPAGLDNWGGWPTPSSDSANNIADLVHAGVNGHGGFYSATDPVSFANGLKGALNRAAERVGSSASLAANSTHLDSGVKTYQALYHTAVWTGELQAFAIDTTDGTLATVPDWSASKKMPAAASRSIYTYNPDTDGMVVFAQANLSSAEKTALGADATAQTNMVAYLRGNNDPDGNVSNWRQRDNLLGDIVNSQPVYVGAPDPNEFTGKTFAGSSAYDAFASGKSSRAGTIYVAANDGMLHGFSAATGAEVMAYLPAAVITSGVSKLASPDYGSTTVPHEYFNDGMPTVADAYFSGAWHTVLVGTTGRGSAKAVYALDVTNPGAPSLLWERSAGDGKSNSDYIGQIVGQPVVAQVADGDWAVLVGNGYNSTEDSAALLQFKLMDGTLTVHKTDDSVNANGLAAPAVWISDQTNGISTVAYAGDLKGGVWKFDLATSNSAGAKVYVAKDASGNPQPITSGMLMGKNPDTGDLWVFFGTGRYLSYADAASTDVQTWYGLIVDSSTAGWPVTASKSRADLAERDIIYQDAGSDTSLAVRAVSTLEDADSVTGKSGWYIDLVYDNNELGESMVAPNQFQGTLLIATSRVSKSSDPCNPSGVGWVMAIAPFTGTNPDDSFFDVNRDGGFTGADKVTVNGKLIPVAGIGLNSTVNSPITIGSVMEVGRSDGVVDPIRISDGGSQVLLKSWRELLGD